MPARGAPVLLFSGHRVDAPGRMPPRFGPALVDAAAAAIDAQVAQATRDAPRPADVLALTQGAAGGDLLFAESCLRRGLHLRLLLPMSAAEFIRGSVRASADGDAWQRRFEAVRAQLREPVLELPAALGPLPAGADAFERCNQWLLDVAREAASHSVPARPICLICLWDGSDGDGAGGVAHMVRAVREQGGDWRWIDLRRL